MSPISDGRHSHSHSRFSKFVSLVSGRPRVFRREFSSTIAHHFQLYIGGQAGLARAGMSLTLFKLSLQQLIISLASDQVSVQRYDCVIKFMI